MALEDKLDKLNGLMERLCDYFETMQTLAKERVASGGGEAPTKSGRGGRRSSAKNDAEAGKDKGETGDKGDDDILETLKSKLADWLDDGYELQTDEDGREMKNEENERMERKRNVRKGFIRKMLDELGYERTGEIEKASDARKMLEWLDMKKGGDDPFAK